MAQAHSPKHGLRSPAVAGEKHPGVVSMLAWLRSRDDSEQSGGKSGALAFAKTGWRLVQTRCLNARKCLLHFPACGSYLLLGCWALASGCPVILYNCAGQEHQTPKGYETSGYFVYTIFGDTGEPIKKENRLFNVRIASPEWRIRIEPLEEKKNGIGYWEVGNTTNGEIIEIVGFAAAYDPNKSPLKPMRAIVNGLGETAGDFNHQTPAPQNPPSGNTPSRRGDLSDNVAVARHFVGDVPRADGSFASFLWFAYTKQTGLKVDSPADGLLPKVWDDGKPLDREMRDAVWTNYENAPYLVKSVLFRWSGVAKQTDGIEIKLDSSIASSNVAASYQVYSTTNLAELVLPRTFEMTRFSRVRSMSDRPKKLTSLVATVVAVSLIESQSTLTIEPPGKTVVSDYRFATEQAPGKPFVYAVKTNLLLETNTIMESERYKAFANTPRSTRSKPPPATWRRGIVLAFTGIMLLSLAALMIRSRRAE